MHVESFKAGVRYNDWLGSVAADDADTGQLSEWIDNKGLKKDGEYLIGFEIFAHSVGDAITLKLLFLPLDGYENVPEKLEATNGPVDVRVVREDISVNEFIELFKQLNICLTKSAMFQGREYKEVV